MVAGMDAAELGFGPAIVSLVAPEGGSLRPIPLAPQSPRECPELDSLRSMSASDLLDGSPVRSADDEQCVRSGLFLYFGALDESHSISQGIRTATGSYWHGIMHRLEGDWSNAKYWFRKTGEHAVLADLELETGRPWDPHDFVDRCAAAAAVGHSPGPLVDLQMLEWQLLMTHCWRAATGR